MKKWYKSAINERSPNTLGGWSKGLPALKRRRYALNSRPKNWKLNTKRLSVGRALQALANVTKDKQTKKVAELDAQYFFKLLK